MIHNTVIIDTDLNNIGHETYIWSYSHVCRDAVIGSNCIIGEGVYIGPNVIIGDNCKIQNHSLIYEGVTIEDDVFIGPNVITTNDLYPRVKGKWSHRFRKTLIKKGASVCANSTILCGIEIGEYSMIGAGSLVCQNIKDWYLAYGNPAHHIKKINK